MSQLRRVLVVGDQSEIDARDGQHELTLGSLVGVEKSLPLRDPMTLEPLGEE